MSNGKGLFEYLGIGAIIAVGLGLGLVVLLILTFAVGYFSMSRSSTTTPFSPARPLR